MTFPSFEAFLAGTPVKTTRLVNVIGVPLHVSLRYVKSAYGVGCFEVVDLATNKLTIESIIDKIVDPSRERHFVWVMYESVKFLHDLKNG